MAGNRDGRKIVVAIDPGKKGGVVWGSSIKDVKWCKMPESIHDLGLLFKEIVADNEGLETEAWLEKITGYMDLRDKDGNKTSASYKSGLSFGKNIGHLEMGMALTELPYREVTPQTWMKQAGVSTIKRQILTPTKWKNYLKQEAQKKFPAIASSITLYTADAFLIFYAKIKNS